MNASLLLTPRTPGLLQSKYLTYPALHNTKFDGFTQHTAWSLCVWHPNSRMVHRRFFATLFKQISDALWKCYKILLNTHNHFVARNLTDRLTALYTKDTLSMCAIHSCFSVAVAAYTANDFPFVHINHPFLYWASSSRDCNFTSSNGIICCLLYLKYVKSYLNMATHSFMSNPKD